MKNLPRALMLFSALFALSFQPTARADGFSPFDTSWNKIKSKIAPKTVEDHYFTESNYRRLRSQLSENSSLEDVEDVLEPFLLSLPVSHMGIYTNSDLDFFFFQSLFKAREISKPQIFHIGVQYEKEAGGLYRIKAVLDGYPADKAHLKRGDLISLVDGKNNFNPIRSFEDGKAHKLTITRNGEKIEKSVKPVFESLHLSFLNAMKKSEHIYKRHGLKIGYVHLWCGTDSAFQAELANVMNSKFKNADRLILDIRDGYGGAWYDYLDPFFADRSSYFKAKFIDRDGKVDFDSAEPIPAHPYFKGPMVLLVNEGVRSGKEALAYQFKKTSRATLIGQSTPGYLSVGEVQFDNNYKNLVLYVSIKQVELDGHVIEKRGVPADISIEYPLDHTLSYDPQLRRALEFFN